MRLLLDTCTFIWLTGAPQELSISAVTALDDEASEHYISLASVWEIVLKYHSGKLLLPEEPRIWIERQRVIHGIEYLHIDTETLYYSGELPRLHRDPFDRLLAAQALILGLQIVSPDKPFRAYGCKVIW